MARLAIYEHHPGCEYLHKQQYNKLAHRRGSVHQHNLLKTYADNKVYHHGNTCEQHAAWHSLAIEHQEEGEIDKSRASLLLQHDEHHRHKHHGKGCGEMLHVVYCESIHTHHLGKGESCGKFGKLRRL